MTLCYRLIFSATDLFSREMWILKPTTISIVISWFMSVWPDMSLERHSKQNSWVAGQIQSVNSQCRRPAMCPCVTQSLLSKMRQIPTVAQVHNLHILGFCWTRINRWYRYIDFTPPLSSTVRKQLNRWVVTILESVFGGELGQTSVISWVCPQLAYTTSIYPSVQDSITSVGITSLQIMLIDPEKDTKYNTFPTIPLWQHL